MSKQLLSLTTQAPGIKSFWSLNDSWLESIQKTNLQLLTSIPFYIGYKTQKVLFSICCSQPVLPTDRTETSHFENFTSNKNLDLFMVRLSKKMGNQHLLPFMLNPRNPLWKMVIRSVLRWSFCTQMSCSCCSPRCFIHFHWVKDRQIKEGVWNTASGGRGRQGTTDWGN